MGDNHALLIQRDGVIQNIVVVILIRGCEMILKERTTTENLLRYTMWYRLHMKMKYEHTRLDYKQKKFKKCFFLLNKVLIIPTNNH